MYIKKHHYADITATFLINFIHVRREKSYFLSITVLNVILGIIVGKLRPNILQYLTEEI